jgi:hypothetical protein
LAIPIARSKICALVAALKSDETSKVNAIMISPIVLQKQHWTGY